LSDAVIQSIDEEKKKVSLLIDIKFDTGLEVGDSKFGTVARTIDSVCFPDDGGCVHGNYTGTRCAWEIQAPPGQQVFLTFEMLDLVADVDHLYLYDVSDVHTDKQSFEHIMRGGDLFLDSSMLISDDSNARTDEVRKPLAAITGKWSLVDSPAHGALSR
jgi:hypothetical protein